MNSSAWKDMSPRDFEELVFWILQKEGFKNVTWYGESGSDKGRDITCQRIEYLGANMLISDCIVQCKNYHRYVPLETIYEDILKAYEYKPDYFILVTTGILSAKTKDWFNSMDEDVRMKMRLILWEKTDLQILMERHPELGEKFWVFQKICG
jgi:HJR/Mrr/RecB family endonuclease